MEDLTGKELGQYRIIEPLGEGGMAAVYKAFQPGMERYVALKILPRHYSEDPTFRERFQQEIQIIAKFQHPHILPVFDNGDQDGYAYLAMPFVRGGTLADMIHGVPLKLSQVRTITSQIGDALDYAHDFGVIHRDIKPSNILIDERENALLTDFGIAKIVGDTANITETGHVVGTPAYMSPEQITGKPLDGRSDIYSLGIVLYEMVTGRTPFRSETPSALFVKHILDPLPPPRSFNPSLPESVEKVVLKSLAKQPGDRYQSVLQMVEAILGAINSEITDKPIPIITDGANNDIYQGDTVLDAPVFNQAADDSHSAVDERPQGRTNERRPLLTGIVIAIAVLLISVIAWNVVQRGSSTSDTALSEIIEVIPVTETPESAENVETENGLEAEISGATVQAGVSTAEDDGPSSTSTGESTPDEPANDGQEGSVLKTSDEPWIPLRGDLSLPSDMPLAVIDDNNVAQIQELARRGNGTVGDIVYSPDGKIFAIASSIGVYLYESQTLDEILLIETDGSVLGVAFSPDGEYLATGTDDNLAQQWQVADGSLLNTFRGHDNAVTAVAFSPDGRLLASASWDDTARIWQIESGESSHILTHPEAVSDVAFGPDGNKVASASRDGKVRLWQADNGILLHTLDGHTDRVTSLAFNMDGSTLASGSEDNTVRLWQTETGEPLDMFEGHSDSVNDVVFANASDYIASASSDGTVRLWDVESGILLHTLSSNSDWVSRVAISPDNMTVASSYPVEGVIRFWDINDGRPLDVFDLHGPSILSADFSHDTTRYAAGLASGDVGLWRTDNGTLIDIFENSFIVAMVDFSPDGQMLAVSSIDPVFSLWSTAEGTLLHTLMGHSSWVRGTAFSPDSSLIASASSDGTVKVWRTDNGSLMRTLENPVEENVQRVHDMSSVVFSPDGETLAAGSTDGIINLWKVSDGTLLRTLNTDHWVRSLLFSPDGLILVSGTEGGILRSWRIDDGTLLHMYGVPTYSPIPSLAFNQNGEILASGDMDGVISIWRVSTAAPLQRLDNHNRAVQALTFGSEDKSLLSGSADGTVRLWGIPMAAE